MTLRVNKFSIGSVKNSQSHGKAKILSNASDNISSIVARPKSLSHKTSKAKEKSSSSIGSISVPSTVVPMMPHIVHHEAFGKNLKGAINDMLAKLGKSLQLKDLALDVNNHCILLFDDRTVLNMDLDEEGEKLVVFAYVGEVPLDAREMAFEKILEANFFWSGTNGGTLGLDKKSQSLVLAKAFELPLKHPEGFEENLATFVDTVEKWIDIIEKITEEMIARSLKEDEE